MNGKDMSESIILNKIKKTILDVTKKYNVKIHKIILFGSRARGNYKDSSDWDILIVTEEKLDWNAKINILSELYDKFGYEGLNVDVVIVSEEEYNKKKEDKGFLEYWVEKEGILI